MSLTWGNVRNLGPSGVLIPGILAAPPVTPATHPHGND